MDQADSVVEEIRHSIIEWHVEHESVLCGGDSMATLAPYGMAVAAAARQW